jgi:NTE family protein
VASGVLLPDVLVLGAGGILGEAWMNGVLAGVEDAAGLDLRRVESFVGTSAGSIVASRLAAGHPPRRPGRGAPVEAGGERAAAADEAERAVEAGDPFAVAEAGHVAGGGGRGARGGARALSAAGAGLGRAVRGAGRAGWAATAPVVPVAVAASAPAGALVRSVLLSRAPTGRRRLSDLHRLVARSGVRFDGRLRVCAVDRGTGRRVVFGAPGAPEATVADAVTASCSIPWVFAPVAIGDREYVDGGAWSVTNLDAAPARAESEVLLLEPTALPAAAWRSREGAVRAALGAATALELQVLRARGARVRRVTPDADSAALMAGGLMRPEPAAAVLAAGVRQGHAIGAGA